MLKLVRRFGASGLLVEICEGLFVYYSVTCYKVPVILRDNSSETKLTFEDEDVWCDDDLNKIIIELVKSNQIIKAVYFALLGCFP